MDAPPFKPLRIVGPLELDKPLHGERRFHVVEDNLVFITLDESRAHYLIASVNQHADLLRERDELQSTLAHTNEAFKATMVGYEADEREFEQVEAERDDLRKQVEELRAKLEHANDPVVDERNQDYD